MHNMEYYCCTPQRGSTVEHGNQGRVMNPSLAGDVEITVSQCNRLYSILVLLLVQQTLFDTGNTPCQWSPGWD